MCILWGHKAEVANPSRACIHHADCLGFSQVVKPVFSFILCNYPFDSNIFTFIAYYSTRKFPEASQALFIWL